MPFTPCTNRDFDFFYRGLAQERLLVQRCSGCGSLRNPPGPSCPGCLSRDWEPIALRGTGTLYSYVVHHHPPLRGFSVPHAVGLVEVDEGIRIVGAMDGMLMPRIGMRVAAEFLQRAGQPGFRFRAADEEGAP